MRLEQWIFFGQRSLGWLGELLLSDFPYGSTSEMSMLSRHFGFPIASMVADYYERSIGADPTEFRLHRKVLGSAIVKSLRELSLLERLRLLFSP